MKYFVFFLVFLISIVVGIYIFTSSQNLSFISPLTSQVKEKIKPLEKYSFQNLKDLSPETTQITLKAVIKQESTFTSHLFSFVVEGKKITGQINIPQNQNKGVILMLRGYIDPESYQTGDGTRNAAAVYASNGFVTIAPDFLGYGGSDDPDADTIAARLKRPHHLLVLLNSLNSLPIKNTDKLFIWGHSNGGQIALSLLEILGRPTPTVLWAPVSKPFPYSILYYTDESDDRGKALRKVIAQFEIDYDVDLYSIHNYYHWIKAPLQIHQGTLDDAVPKNWSDDLVKALDELEIENTYYVYSGADHNLRPSWNTVVQRDLSFFNMHL